MSALLDAIVGLGDFQRDGAPEPSLLPFLARFVSPSKLILAARQAEKCAADNTIAVPAVGRATANVIARRAGKMDARSLYDAAASLPLIGQLTTIEPVPGTGPELSAQIGARIGDAGVVERAIASAFGANELVLARAAGLPVLGSDSVLLQVTMDDIGSVSVSALSAAAARLDPDSSARLLRTWIQSGREPSAIVAGIVEILPQLSEDWRERAAEFALAHIAGGALQSSSLWVVSYLVRRLRETDRGANAPELRELGESLASPWREVVLREGRLEHVPDETALLRSHPYAEVLLGRTKPILRAQADLPLDRMINTWSGPLEQIRFRDKGNSPDALYLNALITELRDGIEIPRLDAFVRRQKYRIVIRLASAKLQSGIVADVPAPLDFTVPHDLYISFFAAWLPATPPAPIVVTGSEGLDSSAPAVEFSVPSHLEKVELTVVLLERIGDELTLIQSGVIEGDVVDSGTVGKGISLHIHPHPVRPPEPTTDGVTIMLGDDTLVVYGARATDGKFRAPADLKKMRAELGDGVLQMWAAIGEAKDQAILADSLVKLAARGSAVLELLKKRLVADADIRRRLFDTDETVRLWSRDLDADLPVEFIYDGPIPDYKHPTLCAKFFDALQDGACRKCENHDGSICAFDFWAFRRRIERRVMDDKDGAPGKSIAARTEKIFPAVTAPAAFAASIKVTSSCREPIMELLNDKTSGNELPAKNWDAWKTLLKQRPHPVLVLLSHTEQVNSLEIENDLIDRQWITEEHVNPQGSVPGPFVLLTGCETARPEYSFLSFVSRFLDKGAAVVVGTLALIREDASATATLQLLSAMKEVVAKDTSIEHRTVGEIMRRTRCRLLAGSDLTGMNLVAYGDADWRFR